MSQYYTVKKTEEVELLTQEINNLQVRIDEKKSLRPERRETLMEKLISWINENIDTEHGLITGAVAHYNLVKIHPFDDGNGRGARCSRYSFNFCDLRSNKFDPNLCAYLRKLIRPRSLNKVRGTCVVAVAITA